MLRALKKLLPAAPNPAASVTYIALVAQARHPFFYETLAVPDTLDGRFEMIVLHLFLLQYRLRLDAPEFARGLSEIFIADMDRSLREIGVSDTGVSKRMKAMGRAYHGRLQAYSLVTERVALEAALARNLYGTVADGNVAHLKTMANYVEAMKTTLAEIPAPELTSGAYVWVSPETLAR
ncbi:MAG: ubiquinol-cytochrome C chaperone family protein [Rickettsiales bacterium]